MKNAHWHIARLFLVLGILALALPACATGRYYPDRDPYVMRTPHPVYVSPASNTGFHDGMVAGQEAARAHDAFDPVRCKSYRVADHDYQSRYGSKDAYQREYREGFEQGYERGYREARRDGTWKPWPKSAEPL